MERHPVVAILLTITGLMVLVPVLIRAVREGHGLRQVWGQLAVGAGILLVACGYGLLEGTWQSVLAVLGLVLAVAGMVGQHR